MSVAVCSSYCLALPGRFGDCFFVLFCLFVCGYGRVRLDLFFALLYVWSCSFCLALPGRFCD